MINPTQAEVDAVARELLATVEEPPRPFLDILGSAWRRFQGTPSERRRRVETDVRVLLDAKCNPDAVRAAVQNEMNDIALQERLRDGH